MHTLIFPFGLFATTSWLTHGVGSVTGVMIPLSTMLSSSVLSFAFTAIGTRRSGITTGVVDGSIVRCWRPGSVPTFPSKVELWSTDATFSKLFPIMWRSCICFAALTPIIGWQALSTTTNFTEYFFLLRGFNMICLLVSLVSKTVSQYDLTVRSEDATRWVAYFSGSRLTDAPESIKKAKGLPFTRMLHLTVPFTEFTQSNVDWESESDSSCTVRTLRSVDFSPLQTLAKWFLSPH